MKADIIKTTNIKKTLLELEKYYGSKNIIFLDVSEKAETSMRFGQFIRYCEHRQITTIKVNCFGNQIVIVGIIPTKEESKKTIEKEIEEVFSEIKGFGTQVNEKNKIEIIKFLKRNNIFPMKFTSYSKNGYIHIWNKNNRQEFTISKNKRDDFVYMNLSILKLAIENPGKAFYDKGEETHMDRIHREVYN